MATTPHSGSGTTFSFAGTNYTVTSITYTVGNTGGGTSLTSYAVCESVGVAYEVNGVTRYTVTFKLLDN